MRRALGVKRVDAQRETWKLINSRIDFGRYLRVLNAPPIAFERVELTVELPRYT